jgi:nitrogen fixation protein FixH
MSDKSQGNHSESVSGAAVVGVLLVFLIVVVVGLLIFIPRYRVYSSEMTGRAELKRAEFNRKIAIYEAEAKKEAAELLAGAEIARARGVAEANVIIGVSLKENEAYLR